MSDARTLPLPEYARLSDDEMRAQAAAFRRQMKRRRTVRSFSDRPVPPVVVQHCIEAAAAAPSGANQQPWHFVAVSDPAVKKQIRIAAEAEERAFYEERAPEEWLEALRPLGTDAEKPFLETAPYLIAIFAQRYGIRDDGSREKHYYVSESVGIATGILITSLHLAGLATLTHTPSPMGFLNEILERPSNERPYLLLVVGHPADDARVPDISRKPFDEVATFI